MGGRQVPLRPCPPPTPPPVRPLCWLAVQNFSAHPPGPSHTDPPAAPLLARSFVLAFSESPQSVRLGPQWGTVTPPRTRKPACAQKSFTTQPDSPGETELLTWADRCPSWEAGEGGAQARVGRAERLTHSAGPLEEEGMGCYLQAAVPATTQALLSSRASWRESASLLGLQAFRGCLLSD